MHHIVAISHTPTKKRSKKKTSIVQVSQIDTEEDQKQKKLKNTFFHGQCHHSIVLHLQENWSFLAFKRHKTTHNTSKLTHIKMTTKPNHCPSSPSF